MDFGNLVGQLMQQGLGGRTNDRLSHATGTQGLGAQGGIDELLGGLLGGRSGGSAAPAAGGMGGILGSLGDMLGAPSGVGEMSRGQVGGLGALAGAVLGGGSLRGAVGGGAMALLGTLALSAMKNWQAGQAQAAAAPGPQVSAAEAEQMTAPETAALCLKGMIGAAKADGQIGQEEMDRIVGKLEEGGVTEDERRLVLDEMAKPLDLEGLAKAIPNRQVGAQVYAASLMAIKLDTPLEQAYMQALASRIGLDGGTVRRLHQLVGAA